MNTDTDVASSDAIQLMLLLERVVEALDEASTQADMMAKEAHDRNLHEIAHVFAKVGDRAFTYTEWVNKLHNELDTAAAELLSEEED